MGSDIPWQVVLTCIKKKKSKLNKKWGASQKAAVLHDLFQTLPPGLCCSVPWLSWMDCDPEV